MLKWIGLLLLLSSFVLAALSGNTTTMVSSLGTSIPHAMQLIVTLSIMMSFWLGIMRVAEKAGLVSALARFVRPILRPLFPDVPDDHPAMGAITMNLCANFIGIGNAATPFGLHAMTQLKKLNPLPGVASNAMCTFLALNTSSVQLLPISAIAILAAAGDPNPMVIIIPTILATSCSTLAAIIATKCLQNTRFFRASKHQEAACMDN